MFFAEVENKRAGKTRFYESVSNRFLCRFVKFLTFIKISIVKYRNVKIEIVDYQFDSIFYHG